MVIFKSGHAHFSSSICMINTFRKDSSLCDVKLIIGNQSLQAHRCVLAAGSPYFRTLFIGHFTEANMNEINLSEVTSSITALEKIVDFIYTGEIDIDKDNIDVIIKLSSFFLIESLEEFCCTFVTDNLSVTTCLRYYLYFVGHGVSLIEKKTWPMVQSRFHDYLIFEEDTLSITTSEMEFLFEKNILQHCSNVSILRFIVIWVNKGLTERHGMIAQNIFDYIMKRENSTDIFSVPVTNELSVDSLYELTESSLSEIDFEGRKLFLNSFKEVLCKITTDNEKNTAETKSQEISKGKETAIIAMFPSHDVIEYNKKKHANYRDRALGPLGPLVTDGPILHVCAYIPRTRCWYSLKKIYNDGSSFALLIDLDDDISRFVALHDELLCIDGDSQDITVINMKDLANQGIESSIYNFLYSEAAAMDEDEDEGEDELVLFDFCLTSGKNNGVYLVSLFRRFENYDFTRISDMFFNCYKLLEKGNRWQKIFQTNLTAQLSNNNYVDKFNHMYATISTVSNEMMIVRSGEFNSVLVADLNQESTYPVTDLSSAIDDPNVIEIGKRTQIIETNDAMYIVTDGTTDKTKDNGKVKVMYEYRLNSKQIRETNSTEVTVGLLQENTVYGIELYPCLTERSASVGDGLWYMEGNDQTSFLTKVTVDDNKTLVIEHHTPPPFHSIAAMFASRISSQILENKEPVTRYLGNE